jgi:HK97 family phage prohead protease
MVIRSRKGEAEVRSGAALLSFLRGELGMGPDEGGVKGERDGLAVELLAGVPFRLAVDGEGEQGTVWTFSTFDLDRFGERIDPAGWDFKRYLENPVVEWAHRYDIPAIGKADHIYTDDRGLHGVVIFNGKDYDPFGWAVGERVKHGVIRAGSVGFRPVEIEIPSKENSRDGTTLIFRKQELLEFSICNVPANPFALRKSGELRVGSEESGMKSKSGESGVRSKELGGSLFWGGLINNL